MTHSHKYLYDKISKLPLEKIGKALSFVRYLEQEPETELVLEPTEEDELYALLNSGNIINSSELLVRIKELPDD
jgi:hypothetical protein